MIRTLFILFLFGLLSGCSKEAESVEFINLNQDFTLRLNQYLSEEGSFPEIQIETTNLVNCTNSEIWSENKIASNGINMTILDILTDGACLEGLTNASTEKEVILPDGEYPFEIGISSVTEFKGRLIIAQDHFELEMDDQDGLNIDRKLLRRVPSRLIWGFISSTDLNIEEVYNLMEAGLSDLASNNVDILSGDYDDFKIHENNQVEVQNAPSNEFSKHFILEHHDNYTGLMDYFNTLRNNNPNIIIQVQESTGIQL